MSLYKSQKQIPETGFCFFQIKEVKIWNDIYFITGNAGTKYSYKIREKDHNWHEHLKVGNWMSVFYRTAYVNGKKYINIYPDINQTTPINPDDIDMDEIEGKQAMLDHEMEKGIETAQAIKDNL